MIDSTDTGRLIGESAQMDVLRREIAAVARSHAKVLIVGETGVGKEMVARLIHEQSARSTKPFLAVNCAGIPDTLLASELFGHVRGSFTGANRDRLGLIAQADGGTLFLDELGEMSLTMQGMLLRFAESGEIQPVGADEPSRVSDVRLISATNCDLPEAIAAGQFREDLYYRVKVATIRVPPLRARGTDVLLLFHHFLSVAAHTHGMSVPELTPDAARMLVGYAWPGNARQVRNIAEALVLREVRTITVDVLPPEVVEGQLLPAAADLAAALSTPPGTQADLVDALWARLMNGEDFWSVVKEAYRTRVITRTALASLVDRGLQETHGSYRALVKLFNLPPSDYKRFHGYLYQRRCHLAVRPYRDPSYRAPRA